MHKPSIVSEQTVENYLVLSVEAAGGVAEKTVSLSGRGYFDRVVVMKGGRVIFVEVKKPRGSHTGTHQRDRHARYRALGAEVALVKTLADVDRLIDHDSAGGVQNSAEPESRDPA